MNPLVTQGRTALITGASSGIGREFSIQLAARGCDLILIARDIERLRELSSTLKDRYRIQAFPIAADLADIQSANAVYEQVTSLGKSVDILINKEGFNVYGQFLQTDLEEEMRMVGVNLVSLVGLSKLFGKDMARRGQGAILNLGSTASFAPAPFASIYAATKAAVLSLSEALAEELKGHGISVTVLCPGPTNTEFAKRAKMLNTRIFSGKLETVEEVVKTGIAAIEHSKVLAITRFAHRIQIFSMRFSPRHLVAKIGKSLLSPTS